MPRVRLHLDRPLAAGEAVPLARAQAHYLFNVMRLRTGDALEAFDGRTGAYEAHVAETGRRGGTLRVDRLCAPLRMPPDVDLVFAPLKPARSAYVVEKATEMGVRRIRPARTRHTQAPAWRADKMRAVAVEAAEQCGGTWVPEVHDLAPLGAVLAEAGDRALVFCDEGLAGRPADGDPVTGAAAAPAPGPVGWDAVPGGPAALVIGPEGGFSEGERALLRARGHPVALGPRILRAETAAVAALALWQSLRGDW